jgi:hypothetical protein
MMNLSQTSHVRGEHARTLMEKALGDYLDSTATPCADREALVVTHQGVQGCQECQRDELYGDDSPSSTISSTL